MRLSNKLRPKTLRTALRRDFWASGRAMGHGWCVDEAFRGKEASMQVMLQWVYYLLISTVNLVIIDESDVPKTVACSCQWNKRDPSATSLEWLAAQRRVQVTDRIWELTKTLVKIQSMYLIIYDYKHIKYKSAYMHVYTYTQCLYT